MSKYEEVLYTWVLISGNQLAEIKKEGVELSSKVETQIKKTSDVLSEAEEQWQKIEEQRQKIEELREKIEKFQETMLLN